jgi:HEXXH motif-containing protein
MTTYHRCPTDLLAGLAGGGGGPGASRALAEAQVSKHLLLIAGLLREWPGPATERDQLAGALEAARAADPVAAVRALGHPMVGAWAAIVGRAAAQGRAEPADVAHLGAVAAVTCAAAGVDGEFAVPVRDGAAALPGVGLALVGDVPTARITVTGHRLTAGSGDGEWLAVRTLRASENGMDVRLALDDVDPYRHGYHAPPEPRLTPEAFELWQELFTEAWRLLTASVPERAGEITGGLHTLVPLAGDGRSSRSATIRHVFGVFGLTLPPSAADFAVTLVHEYQHAKLSALLDIVRLTEPDDGRRFFAPWRRDPRPLSGLLQGVYAFAGVADTWRALRDAPTLRDTAEAEFADARLQVDRSLTTLQASGALTADGERFAGHLRRFVDSLLAVPLPGPVVRQAEQRHHDLHERWSAAAAA